jgi:hypothetical protein
MLRQVVDIGIKNRQCPVHSSVSQKRKRFTNRWDKAAEKYVTLGTRKISKQRIAAKINLFIEVISGLLST